jgi:cupin 2 domain-containing protein
MQGSNVDGGRDRDIFEHILSETVDEEFTELLAAEGLRIERIVSTGQASPPGFWYEQAWSEWVLVLSGSAGLLFDNEPPPRELKKRDYLLIPGADATVSSGQMRRSR